MPIPVDSGWIPVESGLIPVDSSGFQWNPVIPAGMVGGVTSTAGLDRHAVFESRESACRGGYVSDGIFGRRPQFRPQNNTYVHAHIGIP